MGFFLSVWLGFSGTKGSLTSGAGTAWRGGNWYFPGLANTGFHRVSQIRLQQKSGAGRAKLQRASPRLGAMAGFAAFIARTFPGQVPFRLVSTGRMRRPSITPKYGVAERRSRWTISTGIPARRTVLMSLKA